MNDDKGSYFHLFLLSSLIIKLKISEDLNPKKTDRD
jgi:hypothetical protein